jgi:hypothetical protein
VLPDDWQARWAQTKRRLDELRLVDDSGRAVPDCVIQLEPYLIMAVAWSWVVCKRNSNEIVKLTPDCAQKIQFPFRESNKQSHPVVLEFNFLKALESSKITPGVSELSVPARLTSQNIHFNHFASRTVTAATSRCIGSEVRYIVEEQVGDLLNLKANNLVCIYLFSKIFDVELNFSLVFPVDFLP